MFDLFRSRDKAVRILLGVLLVLVALSMLTYLVPGGYSTGASGRDEVVAQVGSDKITMRDVQLQVQQQMRSRSFPPEMAEFFVPQFIERMISDRALAYEAQRLGFQVSDADLAQTIQSVIPQAFEGGKFNKQIYQAVLAQQNMTIPEFEQNVRTSMLVTQLMNLVLEGIVVTPQEVTAEFHRRMDKLKLDYISFTASKFKNDVKVAPAELQAYYASRKDSFTIPEKRGYDAVIFDQGKLSQGLTVPESEVRAAYQSNMDRFRTPDRVKVRHILVKTQGKDEKETKAAESKAEGILKQLKGGADFAELAKKNSDDPGSAAKGGDLDWVTRGQTVKPFEDAAFSLPVKQLSNLVKTEFGYHILQVTEKESAHLKTFDEVKGELETELKKQRVADRLPQVAEQARAEIAKAPTTIEQVVQKLGGTYVKVEPAAQGDPIPEIGVNKEFEQAVFATKRGEVSGLVPVGTDKIAFALVTDVQPVRPAQFGEVESKIRETFVNERAQKLALEKASEAAAKVASGQDLKTVAKSYGLEVKSSGEFGRDGAAEGLGSAEYLQEGFNRKVGDSFGPVTVNDQVVVCKITDKKVADETPLATQRGDMVFALKRKKSQERSELFQDGVLARLMAEKKVKRNDEAIKRLVAGYRNQT